jgi:molybdate/tungstate transport system substrate-binding protein
MVIAYTQKSLYANDVNAENWFNVLQKNEVRVAFSDPLSDPCGVRAIAVLTLAEHLYQKPDLLNQIRYKKQNVIIRPKEIDLIALLELGSADYTIIYKSLAIQHNLNYITLSDSLNLSNPKLHKWYSNFSVQIKQPNQQNLSEKIGLIEYAFCVNKQSTEKTIIEAFKNYLFSGDAKEILNQTGHRLLY